MSPAQAGRFITLEGGEGAGKSTQIARLKAHLETRGRRVVTTREPGGSPGAEMVRKLLVEGPVERWDGHTEALLHFAARRDHLRSTVWPALKQGAWVISDRFADSTRAYQGYGHGLDLGLLLVVAATSTLFPLPMASAGTITLASAGGVVVGAVCIAVLASGARLAPMLPGPLARIAARLPRIERPGPFTWGVLLSLATQTIGALTGHVVVVSLAPQVTLANSFVAIPLAMATAFLPFLVGGTGAREMAFVALYASVGMPEADALAASLLVYSTQLAVGLLGAFLRVR